MAKTYVTKVVNNDDIHLGGSAGLPGLLATAEAGGGLEAPGAPGPAALLGLPPGGLLAMCSLSDDELELELDLEPRLPPCTDGELLPL